ncbi:MAG: ribosomal protein S18-alanine N-acetyltransferase [Halobacteriota archaeon]
MKDGSIYVLSIMIRNYKPTDFQDIVTIERESFAPKNPAYDVFMYISHGDDFLVAEMGGKVIGFISMMDAGVDTRIMSLAVKNEFRRQGIATILINRAIERSRERGKLRVLLEVRTTNYTAQNLYKKKGFEVISTIPYYYNDGGDAYLMQLNLAGR